MVKKYTADYDKTLIFNKVHHELNQVSHYQLQTCVCMVRYQFANRLRTLRDVMYNWYFLLVVQKVLLMLERVINSVNRLL